MPKFSCLTGRRSRAGCRVSKTGSKVSSAGSRVWKAGLPLAAVLAAGCTGVTVSVCCSVVRVTVAGNSRGVG
jgi:ribosomal protein L28